MLSDQASNNDILVKHTAAIHINNNLSLVDRKIYNILIRNAYKDLKLKDTHCISMDILLESLGRNPYTNYSFIKESVSKLVNSSLKFNLLEKDKKRKWESTISLLASAHCSGGVILYSFPKELTLSFANPNIYANLDLSFQKKLNSKYAVALWEFCTEHLDSSRSTARNTNIISLDKLRELLGICEESYSSFKDFKKHVLVNAVNKINKLTDLEVGYRLVKDLRKITGVIFEISRKIKVSPLKVERQLDMFEDGQELINFVNNSLDEQEVYNKAAELKISTKIVQDILVKHDVAELSKALDSIKIKIENKLEIKNIISYLQKILEKGVYEEISSGIVKEGKKQKDLFELENKVANVNQTTRQFYSDCKHIFGEGTYKSWILQLKYVSHDDDQVIFEVDTKFMKNWIEREYSKLLLEAWKNHVPSTTQMKIMQRKEKQ